MCDERVCEGEAISGEWVMCVGEVITLVGSGDECLTPNASAKRIVHSQALYRSLQVGACHTYGR